MFSIYFHSYLTPFFTGLFYFSEGTSSLRSYKSETVNFWFLKIKVIVEVIEFYKV